MAIPHQQVLGLLRHSSPASDAMGSMIDRKPEARNGYSVIDGAGGGDPAKM